MKNTFPLVLALNLLILLYQNSAFSPVVATTLTGAVTKNDVVQDTIEDERGLIKFSSDATLRVSKNNIVTLSFGDMLIDAKQPYLVKALSARVVIQPQSTCLISNRDQTIIIRNLCDNQSKSAYVVVADKWYELSVGQELVFAPSFDKLNSAVVEDKISRRNLRTFEIEGGAFIMQCDYSLISVISKNNLLRKLQKSTVATDRHLFEKTLKMAACINTVMAPHGQYLPVVESAPQQE